MKKSIMLAVAAVALVASTTGCAQPRYNNGYNNGYYNRGYSNVNGWNYAAAALGGAIVGGVIGAIVNSNNQPQYAPQPVYVYPQPVYVYPQACQTIRIPQYDQYGRLVQYIQTCAN
jgi:hypothetical protein